jgi:hypothetical protein
MDSVSTHIIDVTMDLVNAEPSSSTQSGSAALVLERFLVRSDDIMEDLHMIESDCVTVRWYAREEVTSLSGQKKRTMPNKPPHFLVSTLFIRRSTFIGDHNSGTESEFNHGLVLTGSKGSGLGNFAGATARVIIDSVEFRYLRVNDDTVIIFFLFTSQHRRLSIQMPREVLWLLLI